MGSELNFKGTIVVDVDLTLVKASLKMSRSGDLIYDEGAVVRILSDAGVKEGYSLDTVVETIQKFQKSKEPERIEVVAHGELPEPPKPEEWVWSETLPLPESLKSMLPALLKSAPPPEVYSVRLEKVKVEKKQPGKSGLFGSGVEEVVTVFENREVKEKILVDPNPEKTFYVKKGTVLAQILPAKPGKPGKDLEGKPIAPPPLKRGSYLVGKHIEKNKTEAKSTETGLLRIGKTWVDLVPFAMHEWEVVFSEDRSSAFLNFKPGHNHAPQVSASEIVEFLKNEHFPLARVSDLSTIQKLIHDAVLQKSELLSVSLTNDRDASFEIVISPDKTKVSLHIQKSLGNGKPLSLKELGQKLRELELKNFNFEAVRQSIMDFVGGPDDELKDFVLAQGKPPTRGKDKELVFLTEYYPEEKWKAIRSKIESNPKFLDAVPDRDFFPLAKVEKVAFVQKDQKFAELKDPQEGSGEAGVDIYGQVVPPIPGNDPPLELLSNVRRNGDSLEAIQDGLLHVAVIDGVTTLRVHFHIDARVEISRASDNMSAAMTIVQGRGSGNKLERKDIDEALKAKQIAYGIDQTKLEEAFASIMTGHRVENWLIAQGKPAGYDLERRTVFSIPMKVDAQGSKSGTVKAGALVAYYNSPDAASPDGVDVMGNIVPCSEDQVIELRVSEDYEIKNENGQQAIYALKSGEVGFDGFTISMKTQLVVGPVSAKTGNIKFPGEVVVNGNVDSGLYILAGNLKIKGQASGALLSSESNLQIAEGVRGEGKAVLRAKKNVAVGYVERAVVMVVGDLIVQKSAMGNKIRCNGKIYQKLPGGSLYGGQTKSKGGVDVQNLGSPNGTPTIISFGQDYLIEDQIEAEVKETDKLREAVVYLDDLMRRLMNPADKDKLANARQKKVVLLKMLAKRNLKLIYLRDKFDLHCASEIIVRDTLFPGVSIESHGRLYEVKTRKNAIRIFFNESTGHIEDQPLAE